MAKTLGKFAKVAKVDSGPAAGSILKDTGIETTCLSLSREMGDMLVAFFLFLLSPLLSSYICIPILVILHVFTFFSLELFLRPLLRAQRGNNG